MSCPPLVTPQYLRVLFTARRHSDPHRDRRRQETVVTAHRRVAGANSGRRAPCVPPSPMISHKNDHVRRPLGHNRGTCNRKRPVRPPVVP
jgi:hypothetical protein